MLKTHPCGDRFLIITTGVIIVGSLVTILDIFKLLKSKFNSKKGKEKTLMNNFDQFCISLVERVFMTNPIEQSRTQQTNPK